MKKKTQRTAKVGLAPAHTVAEGRVKTGPLWSNLELGYCDDPEGVAESRWLMLSQVRMSARAHTHTHKHTHTCTRPSPLRLQKSEGNRGQSGEAKGEPRSIRRRGHTSQEAREFLSW